MILAVHVEGTCRVSDDLATLCRLGEVAVYEVLDEGVGELAVLCVLLELGSCRDGISLVLRTSSAANRVASLEEGKSYVAADEASGARDEDLRLG